MANRQNLVRRETARRCPIAWLLVALITATVLQLRGSLSAEKAFVNVAGKGGVSRYAGTRKVGVVRHAEDDDDEEYEFQGGNTLMSVADAVPGMAYTGTVTGIAKYRGGSPRAGQELGVNVDLGLGKDVLVIKNKAVSGRADEVVLENTFKTGTVVKVWACPRSEADLQKDIYPFSLVPSKVFPTRRDTPVDKFEELVGKQVMGFVSGTATFGAFVVIKNKEGEFGQGLLPAKLGGDALEVGSVTKVKVLSIDTEKNQLTLCIKEPTVRAGAAAEAELATAVGEERWFTASVREFAKFGAFIDVTTDKGSASGLLPISEIKDEYIADVSEALEIGQEINVRVIKAEDDPVKRRTKLTFSLKLPKAEEPEGTPEAAEVPASS